MRPEHKQLIQLAAQLAELNTGNGVRGEIPKWALLESGDVNFERVAQVARNVLAAEAYPQAKDAVIMLTASYGYALVEKQGRVEIEGWKAHPSFESACLQHIQEYMDASGKPLSFLTADIPPSTKVAPPRPAEELRM